MLIKYNTLDFKLTQGQFSFHVICLSMLYPTTQIWAIVGQGEVGGGGGGLTN